MVSSAVKNGYTLRFLVDVSHGNSLYCVSGSAPMTARRSSQSSAPLRRWGQQRPHTGRTAFVTCCLLLFRLSLRGPPSKLKPRLCSRNVNAEWGRRDLHPQSGQEVVLKTTAFASFATPPFAKTHSLPNYVCISCVILRTNGNLSKSNSFRLNDDDGLRRNFIFTAPIGNVHALHYRGGSDLTATPPR